MLDAVQELFGSQATTVENLGTNGDRTNDILVSVNGRLEGVEVFVERLVIVGPEARVSLTALRMSDRTKGIPDTEHNLESLLLRSRNDILSSVAVASGVGADKRRHTLDSVKVGLVVGGCLAAPIGVLVTQSQTQQTTAVIAGSGSRQSRQQGRKQTRNTHYV